MQLRRACLFPAVTFFLSLALSACANPNQSLHLPLTVTSTETYSVPRNTPKPTPLSTPSLVVYTDVLPTPVNVARLGGGFIYDISWNQSGDQLAVLGRDKVAWYDSTRLTEVTSVPLTLDFQDAQFANGDTSTIYQVWGSSGIDFGLYDIVKQSISAKLFIEENSNIQGSSPNGRLLAVPSRLDENSDPHSLEIWDLSRGEKISELIPNTSEYLRTFAFDGQSSLVTAASSDGHLWLWDLNSGQLLHDLASQATDIYDVQMMPGGNGIAFLTETGDLWLWRISDTKALGPFPLGVNFPLLSISPDGQFVAVIGQGSPLVLIQLSPRLGLVRSMILRHEFDGWILAFSPDASHLASVDRNGDIQIWSTSTGQNTGEIPLYASYFEGLTWSPDSRTIAASGGFEVGQGFVTLWDLGRESLLWRAQPSKGVLSNLLFTPGNDQIITSPSELGDTVSILDTGKGSLLHQINLPSTDAGGLALSPDGTTLAVASGSQILLFDTRSWKNRLTLQAGGKATALAFSLDGNVLRTITQSDTGVSINSWNADSGGLLKSLPLSREGWDYHFSADSNTVVGGGSLLNNYIAFMASAMNGEDLYTVRDTNQGESFEAIALSPDSQLLALGDYDGLTLLDASTGNTLAKIKWEGHPGSMAFSPDSRMLAIGTDTIEIWDLSQLLDSYQSIPETTITPDPILTQTAAAVAAYTPTADLRAYLDKWQTYTDDSLGISFEYPIIYDQIWNGNCVPHSYINEDEKPYATVGERIFLWREPTEGRSLFDYANSQAQLIIEDKYSAFLSLEPRSLGKNGVLSGYELQYRFGSLGRLGLRYFLRHKDFFYLVDFTAGVTCDVREISFSELDALDRLLSTIEFKK